MGRSREGPTPRAAKSEAHWVSEGWESRSERTWRTPERPALWHQKQQGRGGRQAPRKAAWGAQALSRERWQAAVAVPFPGVALASERAEADGDAQPGSASRGTRAATGILSARRPAAGLPGGEGRVWDRLRSGPRGGGVRCAGRAPTGTRASSSGWHALHGVVARREPDKQGQGRHPSRDTRGEPGSGAGPGLQRRTAELAGVSTVCQGALRDALPHPCTTSHTHPTRT